jgi:hypothetical protein
MATATATAVWGSDRLLEAVRSAGWRYDIGDPVARVADGQAGVVAERLLTETTAGLERWYLVAYDSCDLASRELELERAAAGD